MTQAPAGARRWALVGVAPFVLSAVLIWLVWPQVKAHAALALAAYAACVVAFLGGIHWGLAFGDAASHAPGTPRVAGLGWAVVPPLVASVAVMMPPVAGLVILGLMLIVCYLMDRKYYLAHGMSAWLTTRLRLTAIAALCCFVGAAGLLDTP